MKMPCVALSSKEKKTKHNHHNDPALKKILGSRFSRRSHSNFVVDAHQENPPNKEIIRLLVVLVYKMEGPVHREIGIKRTL